MAEQEMLLDSATIPPSRPELYVNHAYTMPNVMRAE